MERTKAGALRKSEAGRGRYDLVSARAVRRLAIVSEGGAVEHGDRNWEKGMPISRCISSALRHLMQYMDGEVDEDHLGRALWNLHTAVHMEEKATEGAFDEETTRAILDLPRHGGDRLRSAPAPALASTGSKHDLEYQAGDGASVHIESEGKCPCGSRAHIYACDACQAQYLGGYRRNDSQRLGTTKGVNDEQAEEPADIA